MYSLLLVPLVIAYLRRGSIKQWFRNKYMIQTLKSKLNTAGIEYADRYCVVNGSDEEYVAYLKVRIIMDMLSPLFVLAPKLIPNATFVKGWYFENVSDIEALLVYIGSSPVAMVCRELRDAGVDILSGNLAFAGHGPCRECTAATNVPNNTSVEVATTETDTAENVAKSDENAPVENTENSQCDENSDENSDENIAFSFEDTLMSLVNSFMNAYYDMVGEQQLQDMRYRAAMDQLKEAHNIPHITQKNINKPTSNLVPNADEFVQQGNICVMPPDMLYNKIKFQDIKNNIASNLNPNANEFVPQSATVMRLKSPTYRDNANDASCEKYYCVHADDDGNLEPDNITTLDSYPPQYVCKACRNGIFTIKTATQEEFNERVKNIMEKEPNANADLIKDKLFNVDSNVDQDKEDDELMSVLLSRIGSDGIACNNAEQSQEERVFNTPVVHHDAVSNMRDTQDTSDAPDVPDIRMRMRMKTPFNKPMPMFYAR